MANQHMSTTELDDVGRMIDKVEAHRMALRELADKLRAMPRGKADETGDNCAGHAALLQLQRATDALDKVGDRLWSYRENTNGEIAA